MVMVVDRFFVQIDGDPFHLWRANEHEGVVRESFALKRHVGRAPLKMLRKIPSKH